MTVMVIIVLITTVFPSTQNGVLKDPMLVVLRAEELFLKSSNGQLYERLAANPWTL